MRARGPAGVTGRGCAAGRRRAYRAGLAAAGALLAVLPGSLTAQPAAPADAAKALDELFRGALRGSGPAGRPAPPPTAVEAAPGPLPAPAPPAAPAAGPSFTLLGVILGDGVEMALLQEPGVAGGRLVRVGERVGAYRLAAVRPDRVVLQGPAGEALVVRMGVGGGERGGAPGTVSPGGLGATALAPGAAALGPGPEAGTPPLERRLRRAGRGDEGAREEWKAERERQRAERHRQKVERQREKGESRRPQAGPPVAAEGEPAGLPGDGAWP